MRIDVVTIFPEYLDALKLSLIGKAGARGTVDLAVHDLRDWTTDRHRTVDDAPLGGGAGMVMKPDVWGAALDDILLPRPRTVLAIPTPSGATYTQRVAQELAGADQIVIACGRYEGIDARVAAHYRASGVQVLEYSIGDYVLNGGEAAALVLVESVVRLLPGVLGNPESLAEESHGADGLLEYPIYTRPASWRGLDAPAVLLGGDHGAVAAWRRARAVERTARLRPDMLAHHPGLGARDAAVLVPLGLLPTPDGARTLTVREGRAGDEEALAALAARTFPLACPAHVSPAQVAAQIAAYLQPENFADYLADPRYRVTLAEVDGQVRGYTLSVLPGPSGGPDTPEEATAVVDRPVAELSKMYVDADLHGSGLSRALMEDALERLRRQTWQGRPLAGVWLGTSQLNKRAHKFYKKTGFTVVGTRHYDVGGSRERDYVFYHPYR